MPDVNGFLAIDPGSECAGVGGDATMSPPPRAGPGVVPLACPCRFGVSFTPARAMATARIHPNRIIHPSGGIVLAFQLFGAIGARSERGELRLSGTLQRALLATLLIAEGNPVSRGSLIDEMWGSNPPLLVENAIQAHVSRLRRKLAVLERELRCTRLRTEHAGYRLILDGATLDVATFVREYDRLKYGDIPRTAAAGEIREVLKIWRGPIYGGSHVGQSCQAAAARYEETRLALLEFLFDCELENFEHRRIIPELQTLLVEHPYHERFRQQLMVALYRCGRQTDALDVYRGLHSQLSEELGLSPSPIMREYERAVLEQDPSLHVRSS
ncbi:AfsR/SARP family transcriptional regulator [Embleya sp. AB8]|uniref:AfsR/SARP family transcriptional regulator n=1 Tax=Embleya sp. AB8 TaxID=3156304 RepID=UPI003C751E83